MKHIPLLGTAFAGSYYSVGEAINSITTGVQNAGEAIANVAHNTGAAAVDVAASIQPPTDNNGLIIEIVKIVGGLAITWLSTWLNGKLGKKKTATP